MNSKSFPSATQSLLTSSNKPTLSFLPSHPSFKFNNTHLNISHISIRTPKITTKTSAGAATGVCIPAPEETLYELLGIPKDGTLTEIKQAYKQMALKYHPDVSPPDRTEEYTLKFIRVHEAYETLSDPEARSMYDSSMEKGLNLACPGKRATRVDPTSNDKSRWKETWTVQISELMKRRRVNPTRVDPASMSWAARIRKQRSNSYCNGPGQDQ